jgi:diguanylate cyclase (GGDEF)-like protein
MPKPSFPRPFATLPPALRALAAIFLVLPLLLPTAAGLAENAEDSAAEIERIVFHHPHEALRNAQAALNAARAKDDRPAQLRALRILVMARTVLEESSELSEDAVRGAQLARERDDKAALCEFIAAQAGFERLQNRYKQSLTLFDEAIAVAERNGLEMSLGRIYVDKSNLYDRLGRSSDALALLVKAYAIFEARNDRFWMANALNGIAGVSNEEKASAEDRAKSIEYYKRALALLDPKVYRSSLSDLYHNLGLAYYNLKDYAQARYYFEKGQAIAVDLDDRNGVAFFGYRLGVLAKEERRYEEALASIDTTIPVFLEGDNISMLFQARLAKADILSRQNRRKESLDALASARALLVRLDTPARDATFYERAAQIYARFDDYENAFRQTVLLRDAEQKRTQAANLRAAAELQTRFDVQQKEAENALLRAQQKEADARRWALFFALLLSLMLLGALGYYLGHQIRLKRRLVSVAMRDELTGLPNRRSIVEFARLQFDARRALDSGLCVALIDLDNFKAINDDFGHDVGDAVLAKFARQCQSALRSHDRLGRYGGEEFLLVMPGVEMSHVPAIFERLRSAAQSLEVPGLPPSRRPSFSMGVAAAGHEGDSLDALINRADEALYRAKQNGRARCETTASEEAREDDLPAGAALRT